MLTTSREHKEAYNHAIEINKISLKTLLKLHGGSDKTIDAWRWMVGRSPTYYAMWQLFKFIKKNKLESSRKLDRIFRIEDQHIKEMVQNEPKTNRP